MMTGGTEDYGGINSRLEQELQTKTNAGIFMTPTILVNNSPYRGSITCTPPIDTARCGVFEMICAGFKTGQQPDACRSDIGCDVGIRRDQCGVCGGNGQVDACGLCMSVTSTAFNKSCAGCDGVPNSHAVRDPCDVCKGDGRVDACGACLSVSSPNFNKSCMGCDNIPNSRKAFDICGVCGGDGKVDACGSCLSEKDPKFINDKNKCVTEVSASGASTGLGSGAIAGITLVGVIALGLVFLLYTRWQNRKMREDIDSLLHQYVPLSVSSSASAETGDRPLQTDKDKSSLLPDDEPKPVPSADQI